MKLEFVAVNILFLFTIVIHGGSGEGIDFGFLHELQRILKSKAKGDPIDSVATDCTTATRLCESAVVPFSNFSSTGGSVFATSVPCCPGTFTQCQIQLNTQLCRDLAYYTINPGQSLSIETCPVTTPACTCQESFSAEKSLSLYLCPNPSNCCPTCECFGDPHCTSFQNGTKMWAICDDRSASCIHEKSSCLQTDYAGKPCVWITNGNLPYCARALDTPVPKMVMYEKTYQSYFVPNDTTLYNFSVILTLGVYGAIVNVEVNDAGASYNFGFTAGPGRKRCMADPSYPLNSESQSIINNLPSGVVLVLYCHEGFGHSPTGTRWDVQSLQDPFFTNPHPAPDTFGGFCATGMINETLGPLHGDCSIFDTQVALYLGCHRITLNECKSRWCRQHASQLQFGSSTNTQQACFDFLVNPLVNNNFIIAVCSVSPSVANGVYPVDPTTCMQNQACQQCVYNVMDYPYAMANILNMASLFTRAPTIPCNIDLLTTGLTRKLLPSVGDGIEIQYQATANGTWIPIFALFDQEIESCDGCRNPLLVNGTDPAFASLLNPGNYRIRQCHGLNTSPSQNLCNAVPAYNVSVSYSFPLNGAAISIPFGGLVRDGLLICNSTAYPGCPPNYPCCIWDYTVQLGSWEICMADTFGPNWKALYPKCGPSP